METKEQSKQWKLNFQNFSFKKAERITIMSNYIKIVFTISGNEMTELQKKSTIVLFLIITINKLYS